MIDIHSHILPKFDDGSKSAEESLKMLEIFKEQGVSTVVATPHFYVEKEGVTDFLKRRSSAFEELKNELSDNLPKVVLGAEVRYYEGISSLENIKDLCIENTNLLLLEMPFCKWSEFAFKELITLSCRGNITLVLAHIERYINFQASGVIDTLLQNGVLLQVNASAFSDFFLKNKILKLLKNQAIHFIGSDCHNLTTRPPQISFAYNAIEKKLGKDFVNDFVQFGNEMFL